METSLKILMCADGSASACSGLEYGLRLAEALHWPVLLLGVEDNLPRLAVQQQMEDYAHQLEEAGLLFESAYEVSNLVDAIAKWTAKAEYLSVYSTPSRSFLSQLLHPAVFRQVMAISPGPMVYVPRVYWPVRKMLICIGGLDYAIPLENLSFKLAAAFGAGITLLHVVEPIAMDYALSRRVEQNWEHVQDTQTPQGRHLRGSLERARAAGMQARLVIRHGAVIEEILSEVKQGGYDLVGLGSTFSAEGLRHVVMPNVAAEVAMRLDRPVLCVRKIGV